MLSCDESVPLIARAVDALLDQQELDRLREHLWQCGSCRTEVESQLSVKRVLTERPGDALPDGFGERLRLRLDGAARHARGHDSLQDPPAAGYASLNANDGTMRWLELFNWRKWSIRLLPAAVALMVWAVMGAWTNRVAGSVDVSSAVEAGTFPGATTAELFVDPKVSDDSLLFVLLCHGSEPPPREHPP